MHEGRARELEENVRAPRRRQRHASSTPTRSSCRRSSPGSTASLVDAPCSGLGVLAARPDLRWRAQPLPELQLALLRVAAERVKPGGTIVYSVCTMNAGRERGRRRRVRPRDRPDLGDEWPQFRHPTRPEFLLTLPHVHRTSGFFIARLTTRLVAAMGWDDWMQNGRGRAVALRGGLRAPGRADRRSPPRRRADLPLRRRRRALRRADHDRADRAPVDLDADPRRRRARRLPPDGRVSRSSTSRRSRGGRRQRHRSITRRATTCRAWSRAARACELQVGLAFKPETSAAYAAHAALSSGVDLVLCMSIEPGYSGQEFMPEALDRIRTVCVDSSRGDARFR